jgi:hypothetical protein
VTQELDALPDALSVFHALSAWMSAVYPGTVRLMDDPLHPVRVDLGTTGEIVVADAEKSTCTHADALAEADKIYAPEQAGA